MCASQESLTDSTQKKPPRQRLFRGSYQDRLERVVNPFRIPRDDSNAKVGIRNEFAKVSGKLFATSLPKEGLAEVEEGFVGPGAVGAGGDVGDLAVGEDQEEVVGSLDIGIRNIGQ